MRTVLRHFRPLLPSVMRVWKLLFLALVMSVCQLAVVISLPLVLKQVIDSAGVGKYGASFILLSILFVLHSVATAGASLIEQIVESRIVNELRLSLLEKLLRYKWSYFANHTIGALTSILINGTAAFRRTMSQVLITGTYHCCRLVLSSWMMLLLNRKLACIMLVIVPATTLLCGRFAAVISKCASSANEQLTALNEKLQETLRAILTVKTHSAEETELLLYRNSATHLMDDEKQLAFVTSRLHAVGDFLDSLALLLLLLYGARSIAQHRLTLGALVAFMFYSPQIRDSVDQLRGVFQQLAATVGSTRELAAILEAEGVCAEYGPEPLAGFDPFSVPSHNRFSIEFCAVSFMYDSRKILNQISFRAEPGERVLIIGPNGAGKTTLLQLLLRLIEPSEGRILVDGAEIARFDVRGVRSLISYVPQEVELFNRSIEENLRFGNTGATKIAVSAAVQAFGLQPLLERLPDGIKTVVGENGSHLSGGERKKIALGRAFIRNCPIVLFDEPTSALDETSLDEFKTHINQAFRGRTVIIVTHDMSLLELGDKIITLDQSGSAAVLPGNSAALHKLAIGITSAPVGSANAFAHEGSKRSNE